MFAIKKLLHIVFILALCLVFLATTAQAKSVRSVVAHSRQIYYQTQDKLSTYKRVSIQGEYTDYYDKKQILRKAVTLSNRKVRGRLKEYRAYYGTDGRLYRYIDAGGKVYDYPGGRSTSVDSERLKFESKFQTIH